MRFIATDCDSAGAQIVTVLMSHMAGITGIAGFTSYLRRPLLRGVCLGVFRLISRGLLLSFRGLVSRIGFAVGGSGFGGGGSKTS